MLIPWTKSCTTSKSDKVALILTEYPTNMQPVRLKRDDDILPDNEITIFSQYYDDFKSYDEFKAKHSNASVVAVAVLGYPCRQETVIQQKLPKIAGFWSKLAYILQDGGSVLLDQDFSCYTSFLNDVGLKRSDRVPKGFHFVPSTDLLKSSWLVKPIIKVEKNKRVFLTPKRPFSYNYLLYLSCQYADHLNPIEDVVLDIDSFKNEDPYIHSVSLTHHMSNEKTSTEMKNEYIRSEHTVEDVAKHIKCCYLHQNKRFTLLSINLINIVPADHDYIVLLDWQINLAQLFTFHVSTYFEPPLSIFLKELITVLKFNLTRIKYCPSTQSWQTYDDTLFRFIKMVPSVVPKIDEYIKTFIPKVSHEDEDILDYEIASEFIKDSLFKDKLMDENTFKERSELGKNLISWFKTLKSTYTNQVDLQITQYLVPLIGSHDDRMAYGERENYDETFCASWVTWFIIQRIVYPDMTADDILGLFLKGSVSRNNFKILLEFSRGIYLLATKVNPPSTCLVYLGDQYTNLFLE